MHGRAALPHFTTTRTTRNALRCVSGVVTITICNNRYGRNSGVNRSPEGRLHAQNSYHNLLRSILTTNAICKVNKYRDFAFTNNKQSFPSSFFTAADEIERLNASPQPLHISLPKLSTIIDT